MSAAVIVAGLLVTAALAWTVFAVNDHNEDRLLRLKVDEAGAVLQAVLPTVQTPLTAAADIAARPPDVLAAFKTYIAAYVGAKGPFTSAALWRVTPESAPQLVAVVGDQPLLATNPRAAQFLDAAMHGPGLSLTGILTGSGRRLGYAFPANSAQEVVYAEGALPANPRIPRSRGTAFADLRFELYLGKTVDPAALLETNTGSLGSRTATTTVPFGDSALTVRAGSYGALGGQLLTNLWWIVAIAGILLSAAAGAVAERLLRRRNAAESLAREVQDLLARQRAISADLQRAMVPAGHIQATGLEIATRYLPGADELEVGGDWYDVIELDDDRVFISVGDVSGRGIGAGTVMASLRSAVRAFVSEGHGPAGLLDRLGALLDIDRDGHFATAVCAVLDRRNHEVTLASAGHLPPLLVSADGTTYLHPPLGPPLGVRMHRSPYTEKRFDLPARGLLLFYTDGLVERRGELLDKGLDRLPHCVEWGDGSVDDMLTAVVEVMATPAVEDDTALLGVRW